MKVLCRNRYALNCAFLQELLFPFFQKIPLRNRFCRDSSLTKMRLQYNLLP